MTKLTGAALCQIAGLSDLPIEIFPVFDELPLGVAVVDLKRRILWVNRAFEALTGFSREEAHLVSCKDVLRSSICLKNCPALKPREANEGLRLEGDIINKERKKLDIRLTSIPITETTGRVVGFLETLEGRATPKELDRSMAKPFSFDHILGQSPKMVEIFNILPAIARTDSPVMILGEAGTGKDLIAEAIHKASERSQGPFIKISCGSLPEKLLESELFGHKKGAFPGALEEKQGKIRLAHNGTLYLTEIGDLPLSLQAKLVPFLDEKIVYPVGSSKGSKADVRLLASSHRNLEQLIKEGTFREDLIFRLNAIRLYLPPLRERKDDVGLLLMHFLKTFAARLGKKAEGFSTSAWQSLMGYHYHGNVRELRNIVEYAINICNDKIIEFKHLPPYLSGEGMATVSQRPREKIGRASAVLSETERPESEVNWSAMERRLIVEALLKAKGRKGKAAEILGWGRSTLWRKMKRYSIEN